MTSFEYVAQGTVLRSSAPFDDANGPGQSVQLIIKTGKIWKGKRREWLAVNSSLGCGIQQTPNDGEWFDFVAVRDENGDLYSDLCLNYCAASMGWFDDSRIGWIDGMP